MKIDTLETHDRLQHFTKQNFDIGECCQNLIDQRPFGQYPFYIFAHSRTEPDGSTKRIIWQPRLTKPSAQTNSMLFKAYPGTDNVEVIWIIPARELWNEYAEGNMLHNETVVTSIHQFQFNREELERRHPDDPHDWEIQDIYKYLSQEANRKKNQTT